MCKEIMEKEAFKGTVETQNIDNLVSEKQNKY